VKEALAMITYKWQRQETVLRQSRLTIPKKYTLDYHLEDALEQVIFDMKNGWHIRQLTATRLYLAGQNELDTDQFIGCVEDIAFLGFEAVKAAIPRFAIGCSGVADIQRLLDSLNAEPHQDRLYPERS